jgi:hypothetical protein
MTPEPRDEKPELSIADREPVWEAEPRFLVAGFASVFLAEAGQAAARARAAVQANDATGVAGATAVTVLLGAAACEAYLSEHLAKHEQAIGTALVERIRDGDNALGQWASLLEHRAPTFPKGESREYRALGCLFQLRNLVAHRGARYYQLGEWPKELGPCVQQQAIPVHKGREPTDWTSAVYVGSVAQWANETASNWVARVSQLGID